MMEIIRTPEELQKKLKQSQTGEIGFVPTMGFLHEGHLSLMERAVKENQTAVASIFVNPLQFGPNEDFESYPRNEERDAEMAEQAGIDYLFIPSAETMYPKEMSIELHMKKRTNVLCGKSRPGHFDGVVAVLAKLFHIVQPDRAYFGQKDAQQLAVIQAFVEDLNFPIDIIGVPIVREADGLAKSSRNVYLSEIERAEAPQIYQALKAAEKVFAKGERNPDRIIAAAVEMINRSTTGTIDYVELLSYPELECLETVGQRAILAAAVKFSKARLIDNLILEADQPLQ